MTTTIKIRVPVTEASVKQEAPPTEYFKFGKPVMKSLDKKWWDKVRELLVSDPFVATKRDKGNYTLLHYACMNDTPLDIIKTLCELNPEALKTPSDPMGKLPIHCAAFYANRLELFEFLLRLFPESIHVKTKIDQTPLNCLEISETPYRLARIAEERIKIMEFLEEKEATGKCSPDKGVMKRSQTAKEEDTAKSSLDDENVEQPVEEHSTPSPCAKSPVDAIE